MAFVTVTMLLLAVSVGGVAAAAAVPCPCANPEWCKPVSVQHKKEVFLFSTNNSMAIWSKFDWTRTTTIGVAGALDLKVVCLAHQHNVRVVPLVDYRGADLTNATRRSMWVKQQLERVQDSFLDGINIDFEEAVPAFNKPLIQGLNDLVNESVHVFKQASPHYQISFDAVFNPECKNIFSRCYDYKTIGSLVDIMFIMDYDEFLSVVAGPNSGYQATMKGLKEYLKVVAPNKLVMGVPWYGYKFTCSELTPSNKCFLAGVPTQITFRTIFNLLSETGAKRMWDEKELSPFFSYKNSTTKVTHQIWYDDPESLIYKYEAANAANLLGVGVWTTMDVDYSDNPLDNAVRLWMWDALPLVNPFPH